MLCYVTLCCVMLRCVMLCYVVLCYVVLCYVMLCCFTLDCCLFASEISKNVAIAVGCDAARLFYGSCFTAKDCHSLHYKQLHFRPKEQHSRLCSYFHDNYKCAIQLLANLLYQTSPKLKDTRAIYSCIIVTCRSAPLS
jgi:hypothetical protein